MIVAERGGEPPPWFDARGEGGPEELEPAHDGLDWSSVHALVESYRRYERRIFRVCLGYLHDRAAAEDATQETFVRAARHVQELSGDVLAAYLVVTARRVCSKEVSRRQRHGLAVSDLRGEERTGDPEAQAVDQQLIAEVWDHLTPRDRALVLCRFAGYSYNDIARRLGMSAMAARVAVRRLRQHARRLLDVVESVVLVPLVRWHAQRRSARAIRSSGAALVRGSAGGVRGGLRVLVGAAGSLVALSWLGVVHVPVAGRGDASQSASALAAPAGAPGGWPQQAQVQFVGAAVSSEYGRDHTVYASGYRTEGCVRSCAVLFRTEDGGSSWQRLPARGFRGGTIVLGRGDPAQPLLFASTADGLQRSDDAGITFRTVVPAIGPVAFSRSAVIVDSEVVIGSQPAWRYHVASGQLTSGPVFPAGIVQLDSLVAGDDGGIIAAGRQMDPVQPMQWDAVVVRCDGDRSCRVTLRIPAATSVLVAASSASRVAALSRGVLYVSDDDGRHFEATRAVDASEGAALAWESVASGPRLVVAATDGDGQLRLWRSPDDGRTLLLLPSLVSSGRLDALVSLSDGRLLAALATPDVAGQRGLRCLRGDQTTWRPSC